MTMSKAVEPMVDSKPTAPTQIGKTGGIAQTKYSRTKTSAFSDVDPWPFIVGRWQHVSRSLERFFIWNYFHDLSTFKWYRKGQIFMSMTISRKQISLVTTSSKVQSSRKAFWNRQPNEDEKTERLKLTSWRKGSPHTQICGRRRGYAHARLYAY